MCDTMEKNNEKEMRPIPLFWCEEQEEFLKTNVNNTKYCDAVLSLSYVHMRELIGLFRRFLSISHIVGLLGGLRDHTTWLTEEERAAIKTIEDLFLKSEDELFDKVALWVE